MDRQPLSHLPNAAIFAMAIVGLAIEIAIVLAIWFSLFYVVVHLTKFF